MNTERATEGMGPVGSIASWCALGQRLGRLGASSAGTPAAGTGVSLTPRDV